jgi:uncharacterized protein (TIGR02996 family)
VDTEDTFLRAIAEAPSDAATRLIFADWLEEKGDARGELLHLLHLLTQGSSPPERPRLETRLRELLANGVEPVGPFWTNSIGMRFSCIPPGTFLMGSPPMETNRTEDEMQHSVTLTKGFFLGIHQVTQGQWQRVMGTNPSHFQGDDLPVEQVAWEECEEFCKMLSEHEGQQYRLATEAEWEYACRAGTTTPFHFGETISAAEANFDGNHPYGDAAKSSYRKRTCKVGSYKPNGYGLFDMHGNVWEWCSDFYGEDYDGIKKPSGIDPREPVFENFYHVFRGGGWNSNGHSCRSANRNYAGQAFRPNFLGCRVVVVPPTRISLS